ncbi:hypothetical protein ACQUEF_01795 [Vagococcus fluvialis]
MRVKELINELMKQNPESEVCFNEAGKLIEVKECYQIAEDLVEIS